MRKQRTRVTQLRKQVVEKPECTPKPRDPCGRRDSCHSFLSRSENDVTPGFRDSRTSGFRVFQERMTESNPFHVDVRERENFKVPEPRKMQFRKAATPCTLLVAARDCIFALSRSNLARAITSVDELQVFTT
jgi:hypothetical protein